MSDERDKIAATLAEHQYIPAHDGPGYCRGCDWESRQIGISSTIQHRTHQADMLASMIREAPHV